MFNEIIFFPKRPQEILGSKERRENTVGSAKKQSLELVIMSHLEKQVGL